MKHLVALFTFFLFVFCKEPLTAQQPAAPKAFIGSLENYRNNDTLFKTKLNNFRNVHFVQDKKAATGGVPVNCSTNNFTGADRRNSKTSIATAPVTNITFGQLLQTLTPDAVMMANTHINKWPNNPRVNDENHNFHLTNVYVFAIRRESDNDYHIIIGDKSGSFLNVEISGLPPSNSPFFQKLSAARAAVDTYLGQPNCNAGGYATFPQGIKITLTGSTFYDIDHAPGAVGPSGFKPKTSWEIHPVTAIKFLQ